MTSGDVIGGILLAVGTSLTPAGIAGTASKAARVAAATKELETVTAATQQAVKLNNVFQTETSVIYSIQTSKGPIQVSAQIVKNGSELQLNEVGVFSEMGPALDLGGEAFKIRTLLMEQAKAQGFKQLRITGQRIGVGKSKQTIDLNIDLTKSHE